jgi:hypothetical protein
MAYHLVLDLLDAGQHDRAARALRMYAVAVTETEFAALINAFVRRGVELRTA